MTFTTIMQHYVFAIIVTGIILCLQVIYVMLPLPESSQYSQTYQASSDECQIIHVASKCYNTREIQECIVLIKSILYYSRSIFTFHLMTSPTGERILQTYMDSWKPNYVDVKYYIEKRESSLAIYYFMRHPPSDTQQLLLLKSNMILISDIRDIWDLTSTTDNTQYVMQTIKSNQRTIDQEFRHIPLEERSPPSDTIDGVVYHYQHMKKPNLCQGFPSDLNEIRPDIKFMYLVICPGEIVKQNNPVIGQSHMDILRQISTLEIVGLFNIHHPEVSHEVTQPESVKELLRVSADILRTRYIPSWCMDPVAKYGIVEDVTHNYINDHCCEYEYQVQIQRRLHLYFYNLDGKENSTVKDDITLVTQLQYNRLASLFKLTGSWEGPMQVVLYLTDEEVELVKADLKGMHKTGRKKISIHVVYKRQVYYPINTFRNIGINETKTDYIWVIDVDFMPKPGLYAQLLRTIKDWKNTGINNRAMVVPTFEGLEDDYIVPDIKKDLIRDIHTGRVQPYHQSYGAFSDGHKPHNYRKWIVAHEPYKVPYESKFEPYIVMPKSKSPLYNPIFVERMMDKYLYTEDIVLRGFDLYVLPDAYIVHIPHEPSTSYTWAEHSMFHECGAIFYEYYLKQIKSSLKLS